MARRARIHSRDLQPQIAAPQGLFAAARVQRFDWPANYPTTAIDEIGRKLHVGTTQETPDVTVTVEAFDVSHNTFAYLTGYTPATFPASGVSITNFQNVDVIGQIKDAATNGILSALYVKRAVVSAMDASFGVTANSTVTYTFSANSKKELKNPVFYDSFTYAGSGALTLSQTPVYLTRTSGYTIDGYLAPAAGANRNLDEGIDYTVAGTAITLTGGVATTGDKLWFTYSSAAAATFQPLDNVAPAAIQGKYVPLSISVNKIPRVQSATIRAAMNAERILEMGGLGKPVGYEVGVPNVTGDVTVLKTDTDLVNILTGQNINTVEGDLEYQVPLSLKITLNDPTNPARPVLTYYVPSFNVTSEADNTQVNQSMQQTFGWESTTGELIVCSGAGPY